MINAALAGFGLAYVPEDLVRPHLATVVSSGCLRTGALCVSENLIRIPSLASALIESASYPRSASNMVRGCNPVRSVEHSRLSCASPGVTLGRRRLGAHSDRGSASLGN